MSEAARLAKELVEFRKKVKELQALLEHAIEVWDSDDISREAFRDEIRDMIDDIKKSLPGESYE